MLQSLIQAFVPGVLKTLDTSCLWTLIFCWKRLNLLNISSMLSQCHPVSVLISALWTVQFLGFSTLYMYILQFLGTHCSKHIFLTLPSPLILLLFHATAFCKCHPLDHVDLYKSFKQYHHTKFKHALPSITKLIYQYCHIRTCVRFQVCVKYSKDLIISNFIITRASLDFHCYHYF